MMRNATGPAPGIAIDLGTVISARAALDYDHERWLSQEPNVQPVRSDRAVIVEYAAHPQATLHMVTSMPVVGGSDKMAASSLLGGIRTYAHLGERPFTYEDWMAAVKAGNTFVTVGPLLDLTVDGQVPGGRLTLPASGGTVDVVWQVASVSLPIDQVEIVVGGLVAEQVNVGRQLTASGNATLPITDSTWIALRVRGSYRGRHGEIAAHSSAVQVLVGDRPLCAAPDALAVLEQIEGAIAYVDTLAPRSEARRFKQLRATLEAAHNRLHQRLHQQGIYHRHTSLHPHDRPREH